MDIGEIVDEKLNIKYVGDDKDKERRKLKRKILYTKQIKMGVERMLVSVGVEAVGVEAVEAEGVEAEIAGVVVVSLT